MDILDYQIEKKVKEETRLNGMTFKELSIKIGMTEAGLYSSLKKNTIKFETLAKIAEILNIPITKLFNDIHGEALEINKEKTELKTTIDLYSNLIDNTAEILKNIWFLSQFIKGMEIPQNILENQENSVKFISDFNKYAKEKQDNWIEAANETLEEMAKEEKEKQKEWIKVYVWQIPKISKLFERFKNLQTLNRVKKNR